MNQKFGVNYASEFCQNLPCLEIQFLSPSFFPLLPPVKLFLLPISPCYIFYRVLVNHPNLYHWFLYLLVYLRFFPVLSIIDLQFPEITEHVNQFALWVALQLDYALGFMKMLIMASEM